MARVAPVVLALALTACSHRVVVFGASAPDGCDRDQMSSERCVGWLFDSVMMGIAYHPYDDPQIAAYVTSIGQRLMAASGDHRAVTFRVLDDTTVQAFSGLSTTVYINRGAIALLRDEAELAAVLGHEIGHVIGGHQHESIAELGRNVEHSALFESETQRFARDDEIQADEVAVLLLARTGYDPRAVATMLRAYAATSPTDGHDTRDPHPAWTERVARVQAVAARYPAGVLRAAEFRAHLATLVIGVDPRTCSLIGDAVVFAHAGFAIDLPPHRRVQVTDGVADIELDATSGLDLRLISSDLVTWFPPSKPTDGDAATETLVRGRTALAISIKGPAAHLRAVALKAQVRAPRADELHAIQPNRFDLDAPRLLWMP